MKKAKTERITKRTLKVLQENRLRRHEASLSAKEFVSDLLYDCVEAACAIAEASKRMKNREVVVKVESEVSKENLIPKESRKRKLKIST